MTRVAALLMSAAAASLLSGCVAAVVPIAAGATLGRKALREDDLPSAATRADDPARLAAQDGVTLLPPGSALPPPAGAAPRPAEAAAPIGTVPAGMQYLYGSGEAAAASVQVWRGLVRHVADKALARPRDSVVLSARASLARPDWVACGKKPPAAVFDVDETVLLNLGFGYATTRGTAYSETAWGDWERTGGSASVAVPGAAKALETLRTMGVVVVFNTNRSAANAAQTAAAIEAAGLGPAKPGETLFLKADDTADTGKDAHRATIAARYCVLAMVGDQLGDFSDLFDAGQGPATRRAEALSTAINARWGAGWFMIPNPVYGTAVRGGADDVFPQDMRWSPSASPALPRAPVTTPPAPATTTQKE